LKKGDFFFADFSPPLAGGKHMMNRDEKKYYRVSDMCRLTGTTRKSLYLYDKEGILKPVRREGSQQHKIYGEEQLNTLKEIERYRKAGFLLEEIRLLL
jgi:DNA-binding transcriptional MerR regulator